MGKVALGEYVSSKLGEFIQFFLDIHLLRYKQMVSQSLE